MQELYKQILEKILKNHPDTVAVMVHGSSLNGNLEDYSDIDFNVFISGKRKNPIENEIIIWKGKKILVNLNFDNYKEALEIMKTENNAEQILVDYTAMREVKILYDKTDFIKKFKKASEERLKVFYEKQKKLMTIKFNILIDFYFKMKRSYAQGNDIKMLSSAKQIASQSARIITFFNKLKPEEMYNSILQNYHAILKLKKTPKNYKKDFMICIGLKENLTKKQIFNSAARIVNETIKFLNKQNLKEIKNPEFFALLEQAGKYLK